MAKSTYTVRGLDVTIKNLNKVKDGVGGAGMKTTMRAATLMVTRSARKKAPVDTGVLRNSISGEVRSFGDTSEGIVGTPVKYAPFMELGTAPHFPPVSALRVWARRHGMNAFVVARAISRRGLKARRFLSGAFDENKARIAALFDAYVKKLVE